MAGNHKNKSFLEKAGEAIDHVLHPEHSKEENVAAEPKAKIKKPKSSSGEHDPKKKSLDYHPKFDKFKKGEQ